MGKSREPRRGFTLIEIMITVAILAVLAALALPTYKHYLFRSRTTEARTIIGGIKSSQQGMFAEFDNYANIAAPHPAPIPSIGFKLPWHPVLPCLPTCSRHTPADCTSFDCISYEPSNDVYYVYASPAIQVPPGASIEFAIGALGDVDGNAANGGFSFQSSNIGNGIGQLWDGISPCPLGVPAFSIYECVPGEW